MKITSRRLFLHVVLGTVLGFCTVDAHANPVTTIINDGNFASADYFEFGAGNANSVTSGHSNTGGNPGAYQYYGMQVLPGQSHYAGALNTHTSYDPSVSGAVGGVTVSFDTANVIFGNGTNYGIAVEQGGTLYRTIIGNTVGNTSNSWGGNQRTDVKTLFSGVNWVDGGEINFGFYSTLTNNGSSSDMNGITGFDNFKVDVEAASTYGTVNTGAQAVAWGGGAENGGVDIAFSNVESSGDLTVNTCNYYTTAYAGCDFNSSSNPTPFELYGDYWNIDFGGSYSSPITITLPTSYPAVGVWHYCDTCTFVGWEFLGGTYDANTGTITVTTDSLSPFALGSAPDNGSTSIPEPATLAIFALGLVGLGYTTRRKRAA